MPQFFIGDDVNDYYLTLLLDGAVYPIPSGATARWWLFPMPSGAASFTPKSISDGSGGTSFANGIIYPVLTGSETGELAAGDYAVAVEITSAGKVHTWADSVITMSSKGV